MNILVIGSGGREHAICKTFARSKRCENIFCAPGNAGIAAVAEIVSIGVENIDALAEFAVENAIDLTFVGGETSLALGIVDEFERRGLKIIGPSQAAARLEASKAFAKAFMTRHRVPTAKYATAHTAETAVLQLKTGGLGGEADPVVVKADGLAAGKGVVVAKDRAEAIDAINEMEGLVGSVAADTIVLEECLIGKEVSLLVFCSGEDFKLMPATRDHKRIGEGDTGPNTGGMGTFTDDSLISPQQTDEIIKTIIEPTLRGCVQDGFPFHGILFLGLMMTSDGPKVLEYNVRFGDPETQSILVRLETDLIDICEGILENKLSELEIRWRPGSSATVVLAAKGYPGSPQKGDVISLPESLPNGVALFHAGTALDSDGNFVTAGGRVLGVTAVGDTLAEALGRAYGTVGNITWNGMQFRRDIGK